MVGKDLDVVIYGWYRTTIRRARGMPKRLGRGLRTTVHLRPDIGRHGTAISASRMCVVVEKVRVGF